MPKLPVVTGQEIVRALERAGFLRKRQTGSHVVLHHPLTNRTVSVPCHAGKEVAKGLMADIIKQAGLTVEEFAELLR